MLFLVASVGSDDDSQGTCSSSNEKENCDGQTEKDWLSVAIIFVGIFAVGIGSTGILSFGLPYLDDNSEKDKSPANLSFAMASRIMGPAFGYILGSLTLRVFANPGQNHEGKNIHEGLFYTNKDKKWICM